MNIVAIIQARMGSSRLPGKVLKDIGGRTMLARVVRRARRSSLIDESVVATTIEPSDAPIVKECENLRVGIFQGSEMDVLDRYYHGAKAYDADAIVRITSDCPLIEPEVIDRVIQAFLDEAPDYASNSIERSYPRGLDVEVLTFDALAEAWKMAKAPYERVHVTPFIYQNPSRFRLLSVKGEIDCSHFRWTVDTQEDLDFVRAIYSRLGNIDTFNWKDVLAILEKEPALAEINCHIRQKSLEEG